MENCYSYHPWQRNHQNHTTNDLKATLITSSKSERKKLEPQISEGPNGSTKFNYIKLPN